MNSACWNWWTDFGDNFWVDVLWTDDREYARISPYHDFAPMKWDRAQDDRRARAHIRRLRSLCAPRDMPASEEKTEEIIEFLL